jgi:hypothetical protein
MHNAPGIVSGARNTWRIWNRMAGTLMKLTEGMLFTWFSRNVLQVWDGGLRPGILAAHRANQF